MYNVHNESQRVRKTWIDPLTACIKRLVTFVGVKWLETNLTWLKCLVTIVGGRGGAYLPRWKCLVTILRGRGGGGLPAVLKVFGDYSRRECNDGAEHPDEGDDDQDPYPGHLGLQRVDDCLRHSTNIIEFVFESRNKKIIR